MPSKGTRSKAKSKAASPEVVDASPDMKAHGERETATTAASEPTARRSKRKAAAQDEAPGADHDQDAAATVATKKPKVIVHTTQVDIVSSGTPAQHQTHHNVKLDLPLSSLMTTAKPTGKRIVFNNDKNDDHQQDDDAAVVSPDGTNEFFTPQGSPTTATTTSAQQPKGSHDDSSSSSDDDMPEAVSTHTAAAQAAKSAQAAAHAAGRQREAERQRRQERDARLKAQAGSRKKQAQDKKESESEAEEETEEKPKKKKKKEAQITPSAAKPTKRFTRNNLPDVLPEEFLASDSETDNDDEEEAKRNKHKPTIIKFNTVARQVAKAESRQPADQRIGSTVYRIIKKKRDEKLAPKGSKYSRNAREGLLGRGRPGANHRTTKGGFLVKR